MESDTSSVTTGEWVVIGLTVAILFLTIAIAAMTYLMWRRKAIHIRFRDNWVVDFGNNPDFAVVQVVAEIAPLGSIMVSECTATLHKGAQRINLFGIDTHVGEALEGARALALQFQLDNKHLPLTEHDRIEIRLQLTDGTKGKFIRPMNTAIHN